MKNSYGVLALSLIFLGSSCSQLEFSLPEQDIDPAFLGWHSISSIYEKRIFQSIREDTTLQYTIYKMPVDQIEVALHQSLPPKAFGEWKEIIDADIFINSGYFLEDYSSAGALFINGDLKTDRELDLDKTGLIFINNGNIELIDTSSMESLLSFRSPESSYLQTYPFLIKNGKAAINEDSKLLARRTVIGTTYTNELIVIIVDKTPISLFELMDILLTETDLEIENALNLDGGPSTGFVADFGDYSEQFLPLTSIPQILTIQQRVED